MKFLEWRERILAFNPGDPANTKEDAVEFVSLVYQMEGRCSSEVIDVLLQTLTDKSDYGTLEAVAAVLASADISLYVRQLVKNLDLLEADAPEWAVILFTDIIHFHSDELVEAAKSMDEKLRQRLVQYLIQEQNEFDDYSPNAFQLVQRIVGESS